MNLKTSVPKSIFVSMQKQVAMLLVEIDRYELEEHPDVKLIVKQLQEKIDGIFEPHFLTLEQLEY